MVQALIVGAILVSSVSLFFSIRGMFRLHSIGQNKLLLCCLCIFLLAPLLFVLGILFIPDDKFNIWTVVPLLLLAAVWILLGYALQIYLRREKAHRLDGIKRQRPCPPPHEIRNDLLLIVASVIIWFMGAFVGLAHPTIETCAMCACVFMFFKGVLSLWRYRKF